MLSIKECLDETLSTRSPTLETSDIADERCWLLRRDGIRDLSAQR